MTPSDGPPAPNNVQALSTSETSVEVWWDEMPYFGQVLGYTVLYTQVAVEDLDVWYKKEVPLTGSAELTGLEVSLPVSDLVADWAICRIPLDAFRVNLCSLLPDSDHVRNPSCCAHEPESRSPFRVDHRAH